ncbi:MAG: hypothetical protein IH913_04760 [Proteobacteria bacterium]|nr:hypothetical protein [Pseudomonadota bacterium]
MISEEKKREILAAFAASLKRDNSAQIESYSLSELRDADAMLGDRDVNADYRLALQNRIADLEKGVDRKHESKVRAWHLVTALIIGLVIAGLAKLLFG